MLEPIEPTIEIHAPTRTAPVLAMLAVAATGFSYLWAYAGTDALVAAGLLSPWQPGSDPRPHRMLVSFGVLSGGFVIIGTFVRLLSRRQLKKIDEMDRAEPV
jgi:hypothetical protein